ncbi:RagB/SusD family nutrient uptake outer membrane protein [Bacteroidota bacterium]
MKEKIIVIILLTLMSSCGDYLEKPLLSNEITQETIFSSRFYAEAFLAQTYRMILPWGFPYTDRKYKFEESRSMEDAMILALEPHYTATSCVANNIHQAGFLPTERRFLNDMFLTNFEGIRQAWIFVENVDKVPDIPAREKEQMKAECRTMIALNYVEMLKHYGGLPLVAEALKGTSPSLTKIARASVDSTINFILGLCDASLNDLPDSYPSQWTGRITKGVALSVKADALLFSASPMFNSATPYLPFSNPELICSGSYDHEKWKKASDASKAVIDWCRANGQDIIDTDNPFDDFGRAVSEHDNQEVILAYKGRYTSQDEINRGFEKYYLPQYSGSFWGFCLLTNTLKYFYKADGTEQTWPQIGDPAEPYDDYLSKMDEMEPRLQQTLWVFGQEPKNNPGHDRFKWDFDKNNGVPGDYLTGAGWMVKFLYKYKNEEMKEWIIYRTAEFYLNYAEALNEYDYAGNLSETLDYLNIIRNRAGIPEILASDPRAASQEELRQLIRRERYVELFGEEHRSFDIRRWRIAHEPGEVGGTAYVFAFTQNAAKDGFTDFYVHAKEERFWADRMYLTPFPEASTTDETSYFQNEVAKGYLIQNPGY